MLSSVKNFFLTFILAVVIFGLIAALVLSVVIGNINGVLDNGSTSSSAITKPADSDRPENATEIESLSVLVIGSDYRDGVFGDYDPDKVQELFGIKKKTVHEPSAPADISFPSQTAAAGIVGDNSEKGNEISETADGSLAIVGGFYKVEYRNIRADLATLVTFDFKNNRTTYLSLDMNSVMKANGSDVTIGDILGKYGIGVYVDAVVSKFKVNVDRYYLVSAEKFPDFYNQFTPVEYVIPLDMKQDDILADVHVGLLQGQRTLTSDEALQLLSFSEYPNSFYSRKDTFTTFIKIFIGQAFSSAEVKNATSRFTAVSSCVTTNLTANDLKNYLGQISFCAGN